MNYKQYMDWCKDNRDNPDFKAELRGVIKYSLRMAVSDECSKCGRWIVNNGECHGKPTSIPCLAYQECKVVDLDNMALKKMIDENMKTIEKEG